MCAYLATLLLHGDDNKTLVCWQMIIICHIRPPVLYKKSGLREMCWKTSSLLIFLGLAPLVDWNINPQAVKSMVKGEFCQEWGSRPSVNAKHRPAWWGLRHGCFAYVTAQRLPRHELTWIWIVFLKEQRRAIVRRDNSWACRKHQPARCLHKGVSRVLWPCSRHPSVYSWCLIIP